MPFSIRRTPRTEACLETRHDDTTSVVSFHVAADIAGPEADKDKAGADNSSNVSHFELAADPMSKPPEVVSSASGTLSAHNISYHVNLPRRFGRCCCSSWQKERNRLRVLSGVTVVFEPGLNAILGNFGAGKTSLLNVLAGRVQRKLVDGTVLLNGHPTPDNFKSLVGFVSQNDAVLGSLTVRENISFSSSLRLPRCLTNEERNERINAVIKELDLENYADVKIGTAYIKGVTLGTRKLCSIGMELVISPPVLFLDEPTTFLDPITSNSIILHLKKLSSRGRTVVFSVTQPRNSAYERFDKILLLSYGATIFHGSPKDVLVFFEKQGFHCPNRNNPADFFMEVINADQTSIPNYHKRERVTNPRLHQQQNKKSSDVESTNNSTIHYDHLVIQDSLIKGFASSEWCASLLRRASDIYARFERRQRLSVVSTGLRKGSSAQTHLSNERYSTSFLNQLLVVSTRAILNLYRNPEMAIRTIFTTLFFAVIMAGIYWQLDTDPGTGFSDRAGLLFFLVLIQLFYNVSSLEKLFAERLLILQENKSGFYSIFVYFFTKIFFDILPLRIIAVGLMSMIVYFAIGLRNSAESFFLFVLCLFLVTMASAGISLLVAFTFETFTAGQMSLSLVYMIMLLFSGYMINLGSLGIWISWMQYLSMIKYGLTALYINEFQDRVFCASSIDNTTCQTGNSYLSQNDMDHGTGWELWQNFFALMLLIVALFAASYIQLRRMAASW